MLVGGGSRFRAGANQHRGDYVTATPSKLHGFWIPDDQSAGGRWYRRSDGSHQYIFGNTHYTFLVNERAVIFNSISSLTLRLSMTTDFVTYSVCSPSKVCLSPLASLGA